MRIIVTGSRRWNDRPAVWSVLDRLYRVHEHLLVVHGACTNFRTGEMIGADLHADQWVWARKAADWNVEVERHPADWDRFYDAAGPLRNSEMVRAGVWCERCQAKGLVVAFPLGVSRGTRGCMQLARHAQITVEDYGRNEKWSKRSWKMPTPTPGASS